MQKVIFLILRRMRAPLIVLIIAYAVSIIGMVLMPGIEQAGQPRHMDFFHAFYFVSYMATTIGFGELPYEFSAAQRVWTMVSIYLSVITWLYAIGKILSLVQDPAFRQAVVENAFARGVRNLAEPFYIVCGYGDTGSLLVRALSQRGMRSVVIDRNPDRINELELEDLNLYVPGLCADASLCEPLQEAGLQHPFCAGVVALTDSDQANLKIAITSKLIAPHLPVICRAETHDAEANMNSFGTDHVINPFDTFGDRLALALHSPGTHLLHEWLTSVPNTPLPMPLYPPHGTWLLCSYGRFGKAVRENLNHESVATVILEANPELMGCEDDECVEGRGTEAHTLLAAGIERAAGIVAGTDDDANNLSIIMTARELNAELFMVARQNKRDNDRIFEAAHLDLVMQRSEIIARNILALLVTPLLHDFLRLMRSLGNDWANELVSRISAITGEMVPVVWGVSVDEVQAPAVAQALAAGGMVTVDDLLRDARDRDNYLGSIALLLLRPTEELATPDLDMPVQLGDQLLFCGRPGAAERMQWTLQNCNALKYVQSGEEMPDGWVWRWLARKRVARS